MLSLTVDETVVEFGHHVHRKLAAIDRLLGMGSTSPEAQEYAARRLHVYQDRLPNDDLVGPFLQDLKNERAVVADSITTLASLRASHDWQSNPAGKGSEFFGAFISEYFEIVRGVKDVRVCSIKLDQFHRSHSSVTHADVEDLLRRSGNLNNDLIASAFEQRRLVVYLEIAESHFHSITPNVLIKRPGDTDRLLFTISFNIITIFIDILKILNVIIRIIILIRIIIHVMNIIIMIKT